MKKILLFGFEGFQGHDRNPSWEQLAHVPAQIGEVQIVKVQLPVVFGTMEGVIRNALSTHKPDVVLGFGLLGSNTEFRYETQGWNFQEYPDNNGVNPQARTDKDPHARMVYASGIPEAVGTKWFGTLPYLISKDAGLYLCNMQGYILGKLKASGQYGDFQYCFVHIPARDDDPQFGSEYKKIPFATMEKMVDGMIAGAIRDILKLTVPTPVDYTSLFPEVKISPQVETLPAAWLWPSGGGTIYTLAMLGDGVKGMPAESAYPAVPSGQVQSLYGVTAAGTVTVGEDKQIDPSLLQVRIFFKTSEFPLSHSLVIKWRDYYASKPVLAAASNSTWPSGMPEAVVRVTGTTVAGAPFVKFFQMKAKDGANYAYNQKLLADLVSAGWDKTQLTKGLAA